MSINRSLDVKCGFGMWPLLAKQPGGTVLCTIRWQSGCLTHSPKSARPDGKKGALEM